MWSVVITGALSLINLPPFKEDLILKPMESGYYTFAKQYASNNQAEIGSTVQEVVVAASAAMDLNAVEESISGFVKGMHQDPDEALDEVTKLHLHWR